MPRAVTASPSDSLRPPAGPAAATSPFGFGSGCRLHEAAEYSAVFSFRRVLRGEHFDLHFRPNAGPSARLGLVMAKKLARRAVMRNRLKRLGREAFRQIRAELPACDLILRLSKPVATLDAAGRRQLRTEIESLLHRLEGQLKR